LWGYAGIDLILTAGGPVILEINPRLTTSYVGLRQATGENPATLMLDLYRTGRLPAPGRQAGEPVEVLLE
jgi:predicted ATP-grasp superfamily ATP-dependent carboligase